MLKTVNGKVGVGLNRDLTDPEVWLLTVGTIHTRPRPYFPTDYFSAEIMFKIHFGAARSLLIFLCPMHTLHHIHKLFPPALSVTTVI